MIGAELKDFLEEQVERFERPEFIEGDPISIPHQFSKKQDIEIAGFWTAMLAWGQRVTIINKSKELMALMDHAPYDFILNHQEIDRKRFLQWKHRTFQVTDTLYFLEFLQQYYRVEDSLETAFSPSPNANNTAQMITSFHHRFFDLECAPKRTQKHVASPHKKATCKRLNMFLRWMVRSADRGVDFGLWKKISPSQLVIPLDVHVERISRELGLLKQKQINWNGAIEITEGLKKFDPDDPVKYDYALFGYGVQKI